MARRPKTKRPAHRPPQYPGEEMAALSIRLPARLKEKLGRVSGGRSAKWICARIERARDIET